MPCDGRLASRLGSTALARAPRAQRHRIAALPAVSNLCTPTDSIQAGSRQGPSVTDGTSAACCTLAGRSAEPECGCPAASSVRWTGSVRH